MVATGFLDSATAAAASSGTTLAAGPEAMRRRIREANYTTEEDLGGGVNETIILTNGEKVVFKSVEGEYEGVLRPGIEPGTQYRREKAASVIDEILKTDLVPPTEIIEWKGRLGSAQLFQKGYKMPFEYADAGELRDRGFGFLSKRQRQDWNLLDMVLGHSDRHGGNWMLYKREGGWDLALIDNGLCLSDSPTPAYALRAMPAAGLKLDQVAQRRLSRLIDTEADWRPRLAELVSPQAIDHMLERARAIQRHGYFPG
jgi:hypothetical protein